jgi:hypothetical protein
MQVGRGREPNSVFRATAFLPTATLLAVHWYDHPFRARPGQVGRLLVFLAAASPCTARAQTIAIKLAHGKDGVEVGLAAFAQRQEVLGSLHRFLQAAQQLLQILVASHEVDL